MDRDYYVAAGRSLAAIEAWDAARKTYFDEVFKLMSANGIRVLDNSFYTNDGRFAGWHIPTNQEVPPAFSRMPRQPECVVPYGKTKVGRELQKKLRALKAPTETSLCHALCGAPYAWMGSRGGSGMHCAGYHLETFDEQQILSCPTGGQPPHDAEPLARSAYWSMREARDATRRPEDAA